MTDLAGFPTHIDEPDLQAVGPVAADIYREDAIDHLVWLDRALVAADIGEIAEATQTMRSAATAIKAYALAELLEQMNAAASKGDLATTRALIEPLLAERAAALASLGQGAASDHRR